MRARRRGWSDMNQDEKLRALWEDTNTALDMAEDQERRLKTLELGFQRLAASVFEIHQKLGLGT
jgi:hypothetical protein